MTTHPRHRDSQEPIPRSLEPSVAERKYLDVLAQIELRRLELKRIDIRRCGIIDEIKNLETVAEKSRQEAMGEP